MAYLPKTAFPQETHCGLCFRSKDITLCHWYTSAIVRHVNDIISYGVLDSTLTHIVQSGSYIWLYQLVRIWRFVWDSAVLPSRNPRVCRCHSAYWTILLHVVHWSTLTQIYTICQPVMNRSIKNWSCIIHINVACVASNAELVQTKSPAFEAYLVLLLFNFVITNDKYDLEIYLDVLNTNILFSRIDCEWLSSQYWQIQDVRNRIKKIGHACLLRKHDKTHIRLLTTIETLMK